MKFYMTPGSCSTGIHILLGLVFEAHIVNLMKGDHLKPDYLAINPNGTVPTLLRDDGAALTDFVEIATWLAEAYPRCKLLPEDAVLARTAVVPFHEADMGERSTRKGPVNACCRPPPGITPSIRPRRSRCGGDKILDNFRFAPRYATRRQKTRRFHHRILKGEISK